MTVRHRRAVILHVLWILVVVLCATVMAVSCNQDPELGNMEPGDGDGDGDGDGNDAGGVPGDAGCPDGGLDGGDAGCGPEIDAAPDAAPDAEVVLPASSPGSSALPW